VVTKNRTLIERGRGVYSTHDEEAIFEVWFQLRRKNTFERTVTAGEKLENHPAWLMGLRDALHEGWMARASLHVSKAREPVMDRDYYDQRAKYQDGKKHNLDAEPGEPS